MHRTENDLSLLLHALAFASRKHRDQRRKDVDASPYINHPIALADILCNEGGIADIEVICAALLHDTVEDTNTTPEELEREFGARVRAIVMQVTDDKALTKSERKRLQVDHATHISTEAKLVKLADKISNLRDLINAPPADWSVGRRREYFDWAGAVVDRLRGVNSRLEAAFDDVFRLRP